MPIAAREHTSDYSFGDRIVSCDALRGTAMAKGRKTGGRNFQKGHPPYRPALPPELRESFPTMLRRHFGNGEIVIEKIWEIATREIRSAKDAAVSLQAAQKILEHMEGRPVQRQELSGPGGSPIRAELAQMSTAALQAHVQSLIARWPKASLPAAATRLLAPAGERQQGCDALPVVEGDLQRQPARSEGLDDGGGDEQ